MNSWVKIGMQVIVFVLPWFLRKMILKNMFAFDLAGGSYIGRSIILAKKVVLSEGARIEGFTFINAIDMLEMGGMSKIGRRNWITGANSNSASFKDGQRCCALQMGDHARVTSGHHIDCTGGVSIGKFSTVAGIRSQLLTHEVDIVQNKQSFGPISIGDYCFVGTGSILLKGSRLPDYSVLGAGGVLTRPHVESFKLYAGVPAKPVKDISDKAGYFHRAHGNVS